MRGGRESTNDARARLCERCGGSYVPRYPAAPRKYCSRSCANKATAAQRVKTGPDHYAWVDGRGSHPLYDRYHAMLRRCGDPMDPEYVNYGGRGITVSERWRQDFWAFVADVGLPPDEKHFMLDRINNDGAYQPGNVRWASMLQQANNRRPAGLATEHTYIVQEYARGSSTAIIAAALGVQPNSLRRYVRKARRP